MFAAREDAPAPATFAPACDPVLAPHLTPEEAARGVARFWELHPDRQAELAKALGRRDGRYGK